MVTRLINASNLLEGKGKYFEEFMDHEIPEYAIVSYRWGNDEVTFKNMEIIESSRKHGSLKGLRVRFSSPRAPDHTQREGYLKIWHAYKQALDDGPIHLDRDLLYRQEQ